MNEQSFLKQKLIESGLYKLPDNEKALIKKTGINSYIYAKLTSKKFRKWTMDQACIERTKKAIEINVRKHVPLQVIFPMGGYKLWRIPSTPEVDWAEFFNISYVLNYLAPIGAAYKNGVNLTYYFHTLLMEKHDNLTTDEISQYVNSFKYLVDEFNKHLPKNFTISILKDADIYTREEYFKALDDGVKKAKNDYEKLAKEKKNYYHKLGSLNIKWQGKEDWQSLSKKQKEEKIYKGVLYELSAVNNLPKVTNAVKAEDKILLFTTASKLFIGIGSTKNSIVKFWTGFGVLEKEQNKYFERILSLSQLEEAKKLNYKRINTSGLINLKNFKEILVFPQRFDFHRKK